MHFLYSGVYWDPPLWATRWKRSLGTLRVLNTSLSGLYLCVHNRSDSTCWLLLNKNINVCTHACWLTSVICTWFIACLHTLGTFTWPHETSLAMWTRQCLNGLKTVQNWFQSRFIIGHVKGGIVNCAIDKVLFSTSLLVPIDTRSTAIAHFRE